MDYHGISMKGPFKGQRVSSLPAWTSDDIGRELYLTTTNKRYYANNVGWVDPDVNKIWTYQDTAPIGWSIITGTSDSLLACKGGGQSYNTVGETQAGTWSQSGHYHSMGVHAHTTSSHTLTEAEMPSHMHTTEIYYNLTTAYGTPSSYTWYRSIPGNTGLTGGNQSHNHGNTGSGGSPSTLLGGGSSNYRPLANIGIVIEKDT